jgi:hypothetical protein
VRAVVRRLMHESATAQMWRAMGASGLKDVDAVALLVADAQRRREATEDAYQDFVRRRSGHETRGLVLALSDDTLRGRMLAEVAPLHDARHPSDAADDAASLAAVRALARAWVARCTTVELGALLPVRASRKGVGAWLQFLQGAMRDGEAEAEWPYTACVLAAHVAGALGVALGALSHDEVSAAWTALDAAPAVAAADEPTRNRRRCDDALHVET